MLFMKLYILESVAKIYGLFRLKSNNKEENVLWTPPAQLVEYLREPKTFRKKVVGKATTTPISESFKFFGENLKYS
jgi:hypothetical protein